MKKEHASLIRENVKYILEDLYRLKEVQNWELPGQFQ